MHTPVLLNEVLQYLDPQPGQYFVDCTVGMGGHALAILAKTAPDGKVLGIDADTESLKILEARITNKELRVGKKCYTGRMARRPPMSLQII